MRALFCMGFENNREFIDCGDKVVEDQLGSVLIAFLSTDFKPWIRKSELDHTAESFEKLCREIEACHPFYYLALRPIVASDDATRLLNRWVLQMEFLQDQVSQIVNPVFLPYQDGLNDMQRLCMLQSKEPQFAAKFMRIPEQLHAERRTYVDGSRFLPVFSPAGGISPPFSVQSRMFFGTDDFETILLFEIEQMAEMNSTLRKCGKCGKYFQPFSSRTLYCDRVQADSGKTCKELAAKEKYEKKIAADEGRSLYRRRNRTYAMRVSRAPKTYLKKDYNTWKVAACDALEQYERGELTLEQLDAALALPEKK